jgi:hypothetical protein
MLTFAQIAAKAKHEARLERDKAPRPPSPVAAMMADEFEDTPFGGSSGTMFPPPEPEPEAAPAATFTIEPPPWQADLDAGNVDLDALAPIAAPSDDKPDALTQMKSTTARPTIRRRGLRRCRPPRRCRASRFRRPTGRKKQRSEPGKTLTRRRRNE